MRTMYVCLPNFRISNKSNSVSLFCPFFRLQKCTEESVVSESTLIGADQQERSSMDHDEASTVASTEQSEAVTHDTAETHSTSTSSKYSIPWVKGLGFLRIYHDEELDKDMYPVYQQQKREIDSILEDLEKVLGQMPIESQKVSRDKTKES